MRGRLAGALVAVLGAALVLPGGGAAHPGHAVTVVEVGNNAFSPAEIDIVVGDGVNWVFRGPDTNHSITADPGQLERFDSDPGNPAPLHAPDDTYYHDFYGAGTYTYHCKVHPEMRGRINVGNPQPPRLLSVKVKPDAFCAKRGCDKPKLKVKVDQPATMTGKVERRRKGRWREVRKLDRAELETGANRVELDAKGLDPGKHRAIVRARDAFGLVSPPEQARFAVRKR